MSNWVIKGQAPVRYTLEILLYNGEWYPRAPRSRECGRDAGRHVASYQ